MTATALFGAGCGAFTPGPEPEDTPEPREWRDELVYQLLTDRFANGDSSNDQKVDLGCPGCYHGGDWQGILDQLDYLEALGVTAIWISPVVENADSPVADAYHGYWPSAFDRANPPFGTEADLSALVAEAHARGMKVIADIVINHAGPVFFYDVNENGTLEMNAPGGQAGNELAPPYDTNGVQNQSFSGLAPAVFFDSGSVSPAVLRDPASYHRRGQILDFNVEEQAIYGDFKGGLRDIDTERPEVRDALLQTTTDWLDRVPLDGYRWDAAKHIPENFWPSFLSDVRAHLGGPSDDDAGFFQFCEVFDGNVPSLASWTKGGKFDAVLDFATKYQIFDDVFVSGASTDRIADVYRQLGANLPDDPHPQGITTSPLTSRLIFLDNHDVPRFLSRKPDVAALHAALGFLLTSEGVPVLYYGTEQEFSGGGDPANRENLWDSGYFTDGDTFAFISKLAGLRKTHESLRRGETRFTWTTTHTGNEVDAGVVAYERFTATERALIVINTRGQSSETWSATDGEMQVSFEPGTHLIDLLDDTAPGWDVTAGATVRIELPPYGVRLLFPAP